MILDSGVLFSATRKSCTEVSKITDKRYVRSCRATDADMPPQRRCRHTQRQHTTYYVAAQARGHGLWPAAVVCCLMVSSLHLRVMHVNTWIIFIYYDSFTNPGRMQD